MHHGQLHSVEATLAYVWLELLSPGAWLSPSAAHPTSPNASRCGSTSSQSCASFPAPPSALSRVSMEPLALYKHSLHQHP